MKDKLSARRLNRRSQLRIGKGGYKGFELRKGLRSGGGRSKEGSVMGPLRGDVGEIAGGFEG